ncbi:MAG: aminoacyl-tRNA hydrolase [Candidatus Omnitrophica bacterium]|nr:aminoacyl-tRNA hydrolase [Candidatus Omnitrophota bacterium]HOX53907.1 aminoacyl-tRNA hydrolase [Candidatus Omnitrophota bacterium]
MKLIVGLGNPGNRYTKTRHNIGYRVVKRLAEKYKADFKRSYLTKSLIAKTQIGSEEVMMILPLTFMNLSGRAIGKIVKRNNIILDNILVVCDDIDSVFGKIKIRPSGSDAGHQGLGSIMDSLATEGIPRLKFGVGRPKNKEDVVDYVLSEFSNEEESNLAELVDRAVACCEAWLGSGIEKAMNEYN